VITFYSYKGGTGRTMALANIAWILASAGQRVLLVDWDLEAPGLHRYFHPFLVDPTLAATSGLMDMVWEFAAATLDRDGDDSPGWHEPFADVLNHTVTVDHDFAGGGVIALLGAGRQDEAYWLKVNSFSWSTFYEKRGGDAFVAALRASMVDQYDYVLIDSRTGVSDTAGICTVQLPDVLVDCFTFGSQSMLGAVAVAESIRRERDLRIWPVPMRVEDAETAKLEVCRDLARVRFDHLLDGLDAEARSRYWGEVEVPYKTFYAYEETLATINDRPTYDGTLLAAYERITGYLTAGTVTRLVPLPEPERRDLAARLSRLPSARSLPAARDVYISYAEPDRAWAEWIAAQLEGAGLSVFLDIHDITPGQQITTTLSQAFRGAAVVLAIVSRSSVTSTYLVQEWELVLETDPDGAGQLLVPVLVDDVHPPGILRRVLALSIHGHGAAAAAELVVGSILRVRPETPAGSAAAATRSGKSRLRRRDSARPPTSPEVGFPGVASPSGPAGASTQTQ
jgi:hypothetical protein